MKGPSKMMVSSSPGRAEKLVAPPFSRLLKGKDGSRSRGRSASSISRSSPMFVLRRRSGAPVEIQDEKEPTSPKVTCIGQVRISKKKKKKCSSRSTAPKQQAEEKQQQQQQQQGKHPPGCRCLEREAMSCNPFPTFPKAKSRAPAPIPPHQHRRRRSLWRRLLSSSCSGSYEQRKEQNQFLKEEDSRPTVVIEESLDRGEWSKEEKEEDREEEEEGEEETKVFVPTPPPKNALLLMRCRSAPHRPSSLTTRIWVPEDGATTAAAATSPKETDPIGDRGVKGEGEVADGVGGGNGNSEESKLTSEVENQEDDSCYGSFRDDEGDSEGAAVGPSPSFSSLPLILTRCKSEPASKAEKLAAPEVSYCFWGSNNKNQVNGNGKNKKRLALAEESFPPHFIPSLNSS